MAAVATAGQKRFDFVTRRPPGGHFSIVNASMTVPSTS